ncbi:helix-turn-helix domain-containing protein [Streptomyces gardneri]|uniref:Transcriptional regulator n=3 Tax=Streptomyces gardneri TaxID=66892 RepID=A0A4Y3RLP1_9ACTN|nr:helix-turn-helix transcriptional regulator [Streptomyces gardneri]GEB58656.1 transcriptional regulator [Streptomyces gardneri]GHG82661.1 transcriptional regulator [Streptomyces gardneri]
MAKGKQDEAWEFFGELLKERREAAGLSQSELGRRVFVSGGYIGLFEQGIRKPQLDVAERLDEVLQTGGIFERTWRKLIDKSPYASYFQATADLEDIATKICEFESTAIPGLLQTPAYAEAVIHASNPLATDEYVADTVKGRIRRSAILKDATRPMYWVILHETALRIPVGGPAVMAEQLDHLVAQARARVVLIQVLPYAAGAYPQMGKPLKLMEFADAPPTAYTEAVYSGNLLDDPAVVKRAQGTYDLLRAAALSPEASLALVESAAEDYRRCARTT